VGRHEGAHIKRGTSTELPHGPKRLRQIPLRIVLPLAPPGRATEALTRWFLVWVESVERANKNVVVACLEAKRDGGWSREAERGCVWLGCPGTAFHLDSTTWTAFKV
jgi:hypothetical protein